MSFKALWFMILFTLVHSLNAEMLQNESKDGEFSFGEWTFSTGMVIVNFTESPSSLTGENISSPESGSVSVIAGAVDYKFSPEGKYHYVFGVTFPLLSSGVGSYFDAHFNMKYYFGEVTARQGVKNSFGTITFKPSLRYYVGGEVALSYLTYSTTSAKKNDTLFNLGIIGGISYDITQKWALRFHTGFSRTTGVLTTGTAMKGLLGAVYYID